MGVAFWHDARGELVRYAGVGLGALGIVIFVRDRITTRRGNRKRQVLRDMRLLTPDQVFPASRQLLEVRGAPGRCLQI